MSTWLEPPLGNSLILIGILILLPVLHAIWRRHVNRQQIEGRPDLEDDER